MLRIIGARIDPADVKTPDEFLRSESFIVYDYNHEPKDIGRCVLLELDGLDSATSHQASTVAMGYANQKKSTEGSSV